MYTVPETFYFPTWKVIERWVHAEQNLESTYGLWTVDEHTVNDMWTLDERFIWSASRECYQPKYNINRLNDKWTPNDVIVLWTHCVRERSETESGSERTVSTQWEHVERTVNARKHGKVERFRDWLLPK